MKRAVIVLLTLCMLCTTIVLPASAEMAADQSLADVIASGAEHLKLTHANHKEYSLEASPYPENLKNDEYKIGSTVFDHADVCFLNVKEGGDSFESQTPGTVTWEIEEGKYNVFQCLWGKGAWEHSAGAKVSLSIIAVGSNGQELTIATSPFVGKGDEPVRVAGLLPDHTVAVKAVCSSEDGSIASCSSIMAQAVVYAADEEYTPTTASTGGTLVFVKKKESGKAYLRFDVEPFYIDIGMRFCYDVMQDVDAPGLGGLNVDGYGDMRDWQGLDEDGNVLGGISIGVQDQNGIGCHATRDISDYAYNKWYTREFDMTYFTGEMTSLLLCADSWPEDPAFISGAGTVYYRNICIKDADGNVVWSFLPTQAAVDGMTEFVVEGTTYEVKVESDGAIVNGPCLPLQYFDIMDTEYQPPVEDTDPIDTATGAGDESEEPSESKPAEKEQGGCGSVIGTAVMIPMLLAAFAYRKKD